jgi:methionine-rich copper-binding protein CopC
MRRVVIAAFLCCVALGLTGAPAAAHDDLASTTPTDGAELSEAPDEVVLIFTDEVQSLGSAVIVWASDGTEVSTGRLAIDGAALTQAIEAPAGADTYTTSYRVVSRDGHPVSGRVSFTVSGASPAQESPAGSVASPQPGSATSTHATALPAWIVVALVVVLVVVIVAGRHRRAER